MENHPENGTEGLAKRCCINNQEQRIIWGIPADVA